MDENGHFTTEDTTYCNLSDYCTQTENTHLFTFIRFRKANSYHWGREKEDGETDTGLVCPDGVALSHVWLRDAGGDYSGAALGLE
jgi:hypothetical protein